MSQREVTDNKALEQFLPQRGRAYQPRAAPWESCRAHFRMLAERRGWSHHTPAPTPAPERCGAPSERIHTNHPCPGRILTVHVTDACPSSNPPGLHPGLVCVDPLGQMEPGVLPGLHPGLVCVAPLGQMESGIHLCARAEPATSHARSREMRRASIVYNGATAGRRCGRRRGKRDLGVLDAEVIVVRRRLLRGAVQKAAGRPPLPTESRPG